MGSPVEIRVHAFVPVAEDSTKAWSPLFQGLDICVRYKINLKFGIYVYNIWRK
jgi:hypothetical protein